MEETNTPIHLSRFDVCPQPEGSVFTAAKAMGPAQREELALYAGAGPATISQKASQRDGSPKFVDQQVASAEQTLHDAFTPKPQDQGFHPEATISRWPREAALPEQLGDRVFTIRLAIDRLAEQTLRASSTIENLNCRLQSYFFLHRHLGPDYLPLLLSFLNHHRFARSERPERGGKNLAEFLTG